MPRRNYLFVPIKPDRLRDMDAEEKTAAVFSAPITRKHHLDPCPLCGGRASIEAGGNGLYTIYNAVCRRCGCSSGSYRSPFWAARRWNTRCCASKPDATDASSVCSVDSTKPTKSAKSSASTPASDACTAGAVSRVARAARVARDLPGQLLLDLEWA